MGDSARILDASVAARFLFDEEGSAVARQAVNGRADWSAPELIFLEIGSVAARRVRRGDISAPHAAEAMQMLRDLVSEVTPLDPLTEPAFQLAATHGFSIYDAIYLAHAHRDGLAVLTADLKLARRAADAGLSALVRTL